MKVLHINSYYYSSRFYKNLYDEEIKNGLDIDVFVPVPYSFKETGFDFGQYTTVSRNHGKYDRYIFHLKHYKIYKDITRKYKIENYSIIHAHSLFSNGYIAMKLKQDYGVPYIVAVRDTDANVFFRKMLYLRKTGINILKEANKIVFLSKAYKDSVIGKYIPIDLREEIYSKAVVIPNGIDKFWLKNTGKAKEIQERDRIKLLQVGVVSKRKNTPTTIKTVEILQNRGYEVDFTIVGRINNNSIYKQIKDKQFTKYISHVPKEELIEIYRENDIFVMPSITETFGLVYAEAMSQGLPVIYTRSQGFDGQFEDGEVGYSVNCFDIEEIADRIICILDNYNTISKRAIKKSMKFDWNVLVDNYQRLYKNIFNNENNDFSI
jgi:glycosyltransferase involved in cell wall biosynthesis